MKKYLNDLQKKKNGYTFKIGERMLYINSDGKICNFYDHVFIPMITRNYKGDIFTACTRYEAPQNEIFVGKDKITCPFCLEHLAGAEAEEALY